MQIRPFDNVFATPKALKRRTCEEVQNFYKLYFDTNCVNCSKLPQNEKVIL